MRSTLLAILLFLNISVAFSAEQGTMPVLEDQELPSCQFRTRQYHSEHGRKELKEALSIHLQRFSHSPDQYLSDYSYPLSCLLYHWINPKRIAPKDAGSIFQQLQELMTHEEGELSDPEILQLLDQLLLYKKSSRQSFKKYIRYTLPVVALLRPEEAGDRQVLFQHHLNEIPDRYIEFYHNITPFQSRSSLAKSWDHFLSTIHSADKDAPEQLTLAKNRLMSESGQISPNWQCNNLSELFENFLDEIATLQPVLRGGKEVGDHQEIVSQIFVMEYIDSCIREGDQPSQQVDVIMEQLHRLEGYSESLTESHAQPSDVISMDAIPAPQSPKPTKSMFISQQRVGMPTKAYLHLGVYPEDVARKMVIKLRGYYGLMATIEKEKCVTWKQECFAVVLSYQSRRAAEKDRTAMDWDDISVDSKFVSVRSKLNRVCLQLLETKHRGGVVRSEILERYGCQK